MALLTMLFGLILGASMASNFWLGFMLEEERKDKLDLWKRATDSEEREKMALLKGSLAEAGRQHDERVKTIIFKPEPPIKVCYQDSAYGNASLKLNT